MANDYTDDYHGGQEAYVAFNETMDIYTNTKDKYVRRVINDFSNRSRIGIKKYGVTLERTDVDLQGWLQHLQHELMDAVLYIERLKEEVK